MKTEQENLEATSKNTEAGKAPAQVFGDMLKQAREEAGFSIERIAMATRITQPFIEALEKGATDKLPGAIFGRGFVRNLCKAYGKDPKPYLLAFEELFVETSSKDSKLHNRDEKRHQQLQKGVLLIQPNEWKKRLKVFAPQNYLQLRPLAFIAGGVLALVFVVNIWQMLQTNSDDVVPSASKESPAAVSNTPTPAVAPVQVAGTQVAGTEASVPASGELDLELRVHEPVAVTYTKDQDKQVVEKLQVQTYKYQFREQFKLYVEDASRVEIYFRGRRVAESAEKGEARRLTFSAAESELAKKASPTSL